MRIHDSGPLAGALLLATGLLASAPLAPAQGLDWRDSFDTYGLGTRLDGQGGWEGWDGFPVDEAVVTDGEYRSAPHSVAVRSGADMVHRLDQAVGGRWTVRAWMFVRPETLGVGSFVLLNTYVPGGKKLWSAQMIFNLNVDTVTTFCGGTNVVAPIPRDRWIELRCEVDLDQDWVDVWFDGTLQCGHPWTPGIFGNDPKGKRRIAALDLFFEPNWVGAPRLYFDDISLTYHGGGRVGRSYCGPAVPNSTGLPAAISGFGSDHADRQPLRVQAHGVPPFQPGYLLVSRNADFVVGPGGSQGNLCLGRPLGAFSGQVQDSGADGVLSVDVDTAALPLLGGVKVQPGETWRFQYWYLDLNPGPTSNFSDGLALTFR